MSDRDIVYFIDHCDDPPCGMGYAEYTCPSCGEYIKDFDEIWYAWQDYPNGKMFTEGKLDVQCPECETELTISKDDSGDWVVSQKL